MCQNSIRTEKISEVSINLADYIGRGAMKDSIQLSGSAYFLDYEIIVELESASNVRGSMSIGVVDSSQNQEDSEDEDSTGKKTEGSVSDASNFTKAANEEAKQPPNPYQQPPLQKQPTQEMAQVDHK